MSNGGLVVFLSLFDSLSDLTFLANREKSIVSRYLALFRRMTGLPDLNLELTIHRPLELNAMKVQCLDKLSSTSSILPAKFCHCVWIFHSSTAPAKAVLHDHGRWASTSFDLHNRKSN